MKIFIAAGGESLGPYTVEEIRQSLRDGDVSPTDLGCREGDSEWTPISQILTGQPNANRPHVARRTVQPIPVKPQRNRAIPTRPAFVTTAPTSPVKIFAAAFLAIIIAGGCLLAGWHLFLREKSAKPFTLSTSKSSGEILERKGQLEGEVFVVTKGGQNYKLGLVEVAIFPIETVQRHLQRKLSEAEAELEKLKPKVKAAFEEMNKAKAEKKAASQAVRDNLREGSLASLDALLKTQTKADDEEYRASALHAALEREEMSYYSGRYYFAGLPEPIVTTQTNSDGKFAIEVPAKGQFAIAAAAKRSVGGSTEHYYWLIKISMDGEPKKTIMLSNNNLSSEGSSASLIKTTDH